MIRCLGHLPIRASASLAARSRITSLAATSLRRQFSTTPNVAADRAFEENLASSIIRDDIDKEPESTNKEPESTEAPEKSPRHVDNFEFCITTRRALRRNFSGIQELTQIQAEAFEPVKAGRDVVARSKTGTGKTLAFLLPLIERLQTMDGRTRPGSASVVILEPTRELAKQVENEVKKLQSGLTAHTIYGGVGYQDQEDAIRRGLDILVATPGRLIDHVERGNLDLSTVMTLVLDEADEMLRIGFQKNVEYLMAEMPASKQTVLFSATMPTWVHSLTRQYLTNPVKLDAITGADQSPTSIQHVAIPCPRGEQASAELIAEIIKQEEDQTGGKTRVIVFAKTKITCGKIAASLLTKGINSEAIHGDVSQFKRESIMAQFRNGKVQVLVATDVAARGLDIPEVGLVIAESMPEEPEMYLHRSGRTGRAGKSGKSIILFNPDDRHLIPGLAQKIGADIEVTSLVGSQEQLDPDDPAVQAEWIAKLAATKEVARKKFEPLATALLEGKQPVEVLAAVLKHHLQPYASCRSVLTSQRGYCTVQVEFDRSGRAVVGDVRRAMALVESALDGQRGNVNFGARLPYPGGVVLDVPSDLVEQMEAKFGLDRWANVSICEKLPEAAMSMGPPPKRVPGGGRGFGLGSAGKRGTYEYGSNASRGGGGRERGEYGSNFSRGGGGRERGDPNRNGFRGGDRDSHRRGGEGVGYNERNGERDAGGPTYMNGSARRPPRGDSPGSGPGNPQLRTDFTERLEELRKKLRQDDGQ